MERLRDVVRREKDGQHKPIKATTLIKPSATVSFYLGNATRSLESPQRRSIHPSQKEARGKKYKVTHPTSNTPALVGFSQVSVRREVDNNWQLQFPDAAFQFYSMYVYSCAYGYRVAHYFSEFIYLFTSLSNSLYILLKIKHIRRTQINTCRFTRYEKKNYLGNQC